ncbi:unnamed protein product, partial [marine sediment metagenome]
KSLHRPADDTLEGKGGIEAPTRILENELDLPQYLLRPSFPG